MTKAELVTFMAKKAGLTKGKAEAALHGFTEAVTSTLKRGSKLALTGFGTFTVSNRKARMGRNPQTGAAIRIKATKVPKFTSGKSLKQAVSGKK